MTQKDLNLLLHPSFSDVLETSLDKDPALLALNPPSGIIPGSLLATQVKYLQKARSKLPTFYLHRCLMEPRAFEQASSERTAAYRSYRGQHCLDLTCGMGVDTFYFSQHFEKVTALEPHPTLFQLTQHNLSKLGVHHLALHNQRAEDFLTSHPVLPNPYDLIYLDPDRRSLSGERQVLLENYQPNVVEWLPRIQSLAKKVLVKVSPLFDIEAAQQLFPTLTKLIVLSVNNECKEMLLEFDATSQTYEGIENGLFRDGRYHTYHFPPTGTYMSSDFPANTQYLYEPDVAFYKSRTTTELFGQYFSNWQGGMNHPEGYFGSPSLYPSYFPGRVFQVLEAFSYRPKRLKKYLTTHNIRLAHISRRHFPIPTSILEKQISTISQGDTYLLFTMDREKNKWVYLTKRLQ